MRNDEHMKTEIEWFNPIESIPDEGIPVLVYYDEDNTFTISMVYKNVWVDEEYKRKQTPYLWTYFPKMI